VNTLTKNRILEAGDEYRDKDGNWKKVPTTELGLQIMFSPYNEVRRPGEAPAQLPPAQLARTQIPAATPLPLAEGPREKVAPSTQVRWDKGPHCIWTGRNGTFKAVAVNLHRLPGNMLDGDIIRIVPVGKRGAAKNALIEFPVSAIPAIIDWLGQHEALGGGEKKVDTP
jgi:hypothetical protein